jgi:hypothetical protein
MKCELLKKNAPERAVELSILMSLCNLQAPHKVLTLRAALNQCFKSKNYIYGAYLATKLIKVIE